LKTLKLQTEDIDKFINALEEMIDARDDMWQEEKFCNYTEMVKIEEKRYRPAKKAMREALHDFIVEVIEKET
jgi:hypothetical protein